MCESDERATNIEGHVLFGLAHLLLGRKGLIRRCLQQFLLLVLVLAWEMPNILNVVALDLPAADRAEANRVIIDFANPGHYKPSTFLWQFLLLLGWHLVALPHIGHPSRRKNKIFDQMTERAFGVDELFGMFQRAGLRASARRRTVVGAASGTW